MGANMNLFVTRNLKRYTLSKDQSIFGPLIKLPEHILKSIGLETREVTNHFETTDDVDPFHSSPLHPSQPILATTATQGPKRSTPTITTYFSHTKAQSSQPFSKRLKQLVSSKKAPRSNPKKGETSSKKHKSRNIESSDEAPVSPSNSQDDPTTVE